MNEINIGLIITVGAACFFAGCIVGDRLENRRLAKRVLAAEDKVSCYEEMLSGRSDMTERAREAGIAPLQHHHKARTQHL